jgi:hypothetical protein
MTDLETEFRNLVQLRLDDDYTGLWEFRRDAARLMPTSSEDELRAFVVPIVLAMLEDGTMQAGDLATSGFAPWNMDPPSAAERIRAGWIQVGTPDVSDVVWFSSPGPPRSQSSGS